MLDVGVYNALLCRGGTGPLTVDSMRMMLGDEDHPCIRYVQDNPNFAYYALSNFASGDAITLKRGERVHLPSGFACLMYYGDRTRMQPLAEASDVMLVGVMHKLLAPGVYDPWVMYSMDDGKQGEFSINMLMRYVHARKAIV